ncbi:hypothetical protein BST36_29895 [Mycolicibacterium moriokaense]|jgi:hypothetical protein|uniref:Peptidoglycolipid exporter Gap n=1 Tax=Mycolicibacterium moriokaense TaxID=39691 RepID=A0AAD1HH79_9MYCO|nr:GAP family protein [Mycolicibacterium moriokaense]MCV7037474.1 GAP family protein [Mycolicibacterium moriokaense]ORB12745.1 hypothetical protein BST36_29895 [Mycolicibacterium moriokaense]BBX04043.1 peptidoglycolipid exporter Gap [Mycolicibacterium moriokaense]
MWGPVLGLALLVALNPILLGFVLLVIARPRPVSNLFVYWVGAMLTNVPVYVAPVILVRVIPGFASFTDGLVQSQEPSPGSIQPGPLGLAVLSLTIATVMAVRPRVRERAKVSVGGGDDTAATVLEPETPGGAKGLLVKAVTTFQRIYGRLTETWENGALWVSFVFGLMYVPSTTLLLIVDTAIVSSGAGLGEQIVAAIAFVVGMLAVLELVLVSCVVAPRKTEAVLRPVHEWARRNNRQIFIVFFVLIGIWQLLRGFGIA